jgi:hypothetical protein
MRPSGGASLPVRFTKDAAVIDAACTVVGITEHLISLELIDHPAVPNLGAIVEFEIAGRGYRSTVQHTGLGGFTVLRPRELDHVADGTVAGVASVDHP